MKYRKNIYLRKYLYCTLLIVCTSGSVWASDIKNTNVNNDPYEYYNRKIFAFNNSVDKIILRPLTVVYSEFVPQLLRSKVSSFLSLWSYPMDAVNYALQGEWEKSQTALIKFTVSMILTAGTADAGEYIENPNYQSTSLNATLASYGFGEGPYIVVPFFGNGSTRDMLSRGMSSLISSQVVDDKTLLRLYYLNILDTRSKYLGADKAFQNTSLDYYATMRSLSLDSARQAIEGTSNEPVNINKDIFADDDSDDDLTW